MKQSRLRNHLVWGYTLFIIYGSLSPFTGWQNTAHSFLSVLSAPLSLTYTAFDATLNLLAYLPFGLFLFLALRSRMTTAQRLMITILAGVSLSVGMEYVQLYLPARISSNLDILTNTCGTVAGALFGASIAPSILFARITILRHRMVHPGRTMNFGLALICLWCFAQINPSLPLLGNLFIGEPPQPSAARALEPFNQLECMASSLNLLMLGTLLYFLLRHRHNAFPALVTVLGFVTMLKLVASLFLLKSWALLLWLNGSAITGIFAGLAIFSASLLMPRHVILAIGSTSALIHLLIGFFINDSNAPASAKALFHWHYGHLLNFNGLSKTIALLFPFLLLFFFWRIRNAPAEQL